MPFTTGDFQSFDIQSRIVIEHGDADRVLLRINKESRATAAGLQTLEKQIDKTTGAFRKFSAASEISRQASHSAKGIGTSIHQGLAQGITSGNANVNKATSALVQSSINTAKKQLGIRSPSLVFAGIGNFIVRGLAQGISSSTGIAESAVSGLISGLTLTASTAAQLGLESIKLAANFERTTNSVRVYAGSLTAAQRELKAVSDLSANTPGLRLESAEIGYQRLRSVSFEADRARGLLAGLAKEKVLSGADNEAIERVIHNFGQLKVGAQSFGQELREILTQLPSLRRTFLGAFGTLNPQKIQALFGTNPDAFFEKLSAEMLKTQGITSDTIDSFDKLQDEFIKAGREFAKPLLPGITKELQNATAFLRENGAEWAAWGQSIANVLRGARIKYEEFKESQKPDTSFQGKSKAAINDPIINAVSSAAGSLFNILNPGFGDFKQIFTDLADTGSDKTSSLVKAQQEKLKREADRIEEFKTQQANKEFDRLAKDELQRNAALRILDNYHSSRISIIENAISIESALAEAKPVFNSEQEKASMKRQTDLRSAGLNALLRVETDLYKERERLNAGNKLELEKIELERGKTLGKIQTDIIVNQIKGQKEQERIDREIILKKREALQAFRRLQISGVEQFGQSTAGIIRDSLEQGITTARSGYADLIQLTESSYQKISNLTATGYREQLNDLSLTKEQRQNLTTQMFLDERKLAEDNSRKIIEIQREQFEKSNAFFKSQAEQIRKASQARGQLFSQANASFFQPDISFGEGFKKFGQGVFDVGTEIKLNEKLNDVLTGRSSIYDVQKDFQTKAHTLETANLEREIDLTKDLIRLEEIRLKSNLRSNIAAAQSRIDLLNNQKSRLGGQATEGIDSEIALIGKQIADWRAVLNLTDKQISEFFGRESSVIKTLNNDVKNLSDSVNNLKQTQAGERQNLFAGTTEGLKEYFAALKSGQKSAIVSQLTENQLWRERVDLATEILFLRERIGQSPIIDSQAIEIAQLEEIVRLRNEAQSAAASSAIAGNRVSIVDTLAKQQRVGALKEKDNQQSLLKLQQAAALARVAGLENEQSEKERILKEYAEKFLKAEKDYQDKLGKISISNLALGASAARADSRDKNPFSSAITQGIGSQFGLGAVGNAIDNAGILASADGIISATDRTAIAAAANKEVWIDYGNTVAGVFGQMASATESALAGFIATGELGSAAFASLAASVIASLAVQAGTKSLFEVAEAIKEKALAAAALAVGNVPGAALHAAAAAAHITAAKTYGLIGAGAAAVGIGIGAAGGLGGGGGRAGNPNQGQPDYYTSPPNQQQLQQNQQITPQQVQNRNSEGFMYERINKEIVKLVNSSNQELLTEVRYLAEAVSGLNNNIDSMPPGNVVSKGIRGNESLIGDTVVRDMQVSHSKVKKLSELIYQK